MFLQYSSLAMTQHDASSMPPTWDAHHRLDESFSNAVKGFWKRKTFAQESSIGVWFYMFLKLSLEVQRVKFDISFSLRSFLIGGLFLLFLPAPYKPILPPCRRGTIIWCGEFYSRPLLQQLVSSTGSTIGTFGAMARP